MQVGCHLRWSQCHLTIARSQSPICVQFGLSLRVHQFLDNRREWIKLISKWLHLRNDKYCQSDKTEGLVEAHWLPQFQGGICLQRWVSQHALWLSLTVYEVFCAVFMSWTGEKQKARCLPKSKQNKPKHNTTPKQPHKEDTQKTTVGGLGSEDDKTVIPWPKNWNPIFSSKCTVLARHD